MRSPDQPWPAVVARADGPRAGAGVPAHTFPPLAANPRAPENETRILGLGKGEAMRTVLRQAIRPAVTSTLFLFLLLSVLMAGTAAAATRAKGTLGVALGDITPQIQQAAGLQQVTGAVIQQVLPGSAAAQVGLQPGDLIIGVDGAGVSGPAEVVQRVGHHGAGERVALVILRPDGQGRVQQYQVTPVLQPAAGVAASPPTPPASGAPPPQQAPAAPSPLGTGFAGGMVPVRLHVDVYRTCKAFAPANWVIYGSRREGDALDMAAADRSMYASYGIGGVPGLLARTNPQGYGTPEVRIHASLSVGGRLQVAYGQPLQDPTFGYTWLPFELPDYRGGVLYRVWPIPNDPGGYIMLSRRAQTAKPLWEWQGAQAIAVALSIQCIKQLQPSPDVPGGRRPPGGGDVESTYNQQLGMEYAHDPATGENYWVSHGTDWNATGPEGPGYYKQSGNDRRKLVPGRSE